MTGGLAWNFTGELLRHLRTGTLACREFMEATLAAVDAGEEGVRAWIRLMDRERLLVEADAMDRIPLDRRRPLHGLPLGVKDTIDTLDLPTELGGRLWQGRQPDRDAACVARARAAGAIILGKTVTTEYALREPSVTRHPRDPGRSPGGSSSGSAAAVATGMAPLALGSQTNGSVLRPASYCGVYGFKPTFGLLPLTGVAPIAPTLDTLGIFSRDVSGLVTATEALARPDASIRSRREGLEQAVNRRRGRTWRVGFVKAAWSQAEPYVRDAVEVFAERLRTGHSVQTISWPSTLERVFEEHMIIQDAGLAAYLGDLGETRTMQLSPGLQANIERGRQISATKLTHALAVQEQVRAYVENCFDDVDVLITAATACEAPDLSTTGDPVMSTIWTDAGTPAVSVPVLQGPSGFPLGLQVIARRGSDADALAFAAAIGDGHFHTSRQ